jgi:ferredoxin
MCPAPEKAIKILNTFKTTDKDGMEVEIQQPYVDHDLCVGCGICESNCTIPGVAGIRLQRRDAPDPGTEFLLKSTLESRKASETHQGDPKAETPAASPYGS